MGQPCPSPAPESAQHQQMLHSTTRELLAVSPTEQLAFPMIVHGMDLADNEETPSVDLAETLGGHPDATFLSHARDDLLNQLGIFRGDQLLIDRKLRPQNNDVVLACIDGDLICRVLDLQKGQLTNTDPDSPDLLLDEQEELLIIGVVTHNIRSFR